MYAVDQQDRVVPLGDLPQSCVGAPCPVVLAEEGGLVVAYFLENTPPDWDGTTVRMVGSDSPGEPAAVVRFVRPRASMFGPPNNEAFAGHPLASRGLHPFAAFEVLNSSWIRTLERLNSVHPYHRPERFATLRHFVLAFHDSTFECVAEGYAWEHAQGPLTTLIAREAVREAGHSLDAEADAARTFAECARRYCAFIGEAHSLPLPTRLRRARELLAELVQLGGSLPEGDASAVEPEAHVALPQNGLGMGEFDWYAETLNPHAENATTGTGSLTDDLLDTYQDLRRGLLLYDAGDVGAAAWDWRFHFDAHWGDHAVSALRALHRACQRSTTS